MPDLRYRTFRMKVYGRLCPPQLGLGERDRFMALLDADDEEGMEAFLEGQPLRDPEKRVVRILKEARELGERINVLDRMLPSLPHTEISEHYSRLRALGNEISDIEALGSLR